VFNWGTNHPVAGSSFDYTGLSQQTTFAGTALPGGVSAMWLGNANGDDEVKYVAPSDDVNTIFANVLTFGPNTTFTPGFGLVYTYGSGDIDMNGQVKYVAPADDRNIIFTQVVLYPLNTLFTPGFGLMFEQLP
jgi:hypothetical protein